MRAETVRLIRVEINKDINFEAPILTRADREIFKASVVQGELCCFIWGEMHEVDHRYMMNGDSTPLGACGCLGGVAARTGGEFTEFPPPDQLNH